MDVVVVVVEAVEHCCRGSKVLALNSWREGSMAFCSS